MISMIVYSDVASFAGLAAAFTEWSGLSRGVWSIQAA
jgi:hypothetical protein